MYFRQPGLRELLPLRSVNPTFAEAGPNPAVLIAILNQSMHKSVLA